MYNWRAKLLSSDQHSHMTLTGISWQHGYIITKHEEITEVNFGFVFIIEITISVNIHIWPWVFVERQVYRIKIWIHCCLEILQYTGLFISPQHPFSTDLPPLEGSSGTIRQIFQLDSSKRTVKFPVDKTDRFWLYVYRWYITGCIPCMSISLSVHTAAECPRTDCRNSGR